MDDYIHDILEAQERNINRTASLFDCFQEHVALRGRELRDILYAFCGSEVNEIKKLKEKMGVAGTVREEEIAGRVAEYLSRDTPAGDDGIELQYIVTHLKTTITDLISDKWERVTDPIEIQFYLVSGICYYDGLLTKLSADEVEWAFPFMLQVDRRMGEIRRLAIAQIVTSHDTIGKANTKIGSVRGQARKKERNQDEIERAFREIEEDDLPLKLTLSNVAGKILAKYPDIKGESKPDVKTFKAFLNDKYGITAGNIEKVRNIVRNN